MGFIEDVQAWLKAQASPPAPLPPLPPGFDLEKRRGVMWGALERVPTKYQKRSYEEWTRDGYLDWFVAQVGTGMRRGVAARWQLGRLGKALDSLIVSQVERSALASIEVGGEIAKLELLRHSDIARDSFVSDGPRTYLAVRQQAWTRALCLIDDNGAVTRIGQTVIALAGRQAIHLVLELETTLSTGTADDYRVARSRLREILKEPLVADWLAPGAAYSTWERMCQLGVAELVDGTNMYTVAPDAEDLLRTVLDPAPNPYRALVQALLDAERGKVTSSLTGQPNNAGSDLAYVRMVVHELRNISFPLATALRSLWEELERPTIDPARISELRERLDRSVAGITEFSNVSARLALAVTEETFSLRDAVDAAIDTTIPERNGRIRVDTNGLVDASIDGARMRWTLLFVNLLRNAAQSRAGSGTVWIHSRWNAAGTLHLYVDDDGPGVPEELREQILEMGVSLRGGSGWGLHEARTTVLLCGGSMRCEASPQGGARFFIRVPARSHA
jgi:two-component system sensor histidine kinase HydH